MQSSVELYFQKVVARLLFLINHPLYQFFFFKVVTVVRVKVSHNTAAGNVWIATKKTLPSPKDIKTSTKCIRRIYHSEVLHLVM